MFRVVSNHNFYWHVLEKRLKRGCRSLGPAFPASFEPLAHNRNLANLSLL